MIIKFMEIFCEYLFDLIIYLHESFMRYSGKKFTLTKYLKSLEAFNVPHLKDEFI